MNLAKLLALIALAKKYGPAVAELIQQLLEQFKSDPDARVFQGAPQQAFCPEGGCDEKVEEEECAVESALYHVDVASEYGGYAKEHLDKARELLKKHLKDCHDEDTKGA